MSKSVGSWIFCSDGLKRGYLSVVDESVEEVCLGSPPAGSERGLILPGFANSHTHLGDSCAYPAPKGTVKDLVGPPDGYKHRILKCTSDTDKVLAMRKSLELMSTTGTVAFSDFREEGRAGIRTIRDALDRSELKATILGRPAKEEIAEEEADQILSECDGLGMSAVSDWPMGVLESLSSKCRAKGKIFALHASEVEREDIDVILSLRPTFLVHMTKASGHDLEACREASVPIVVCPRSYEFFGTRNDIGPKIRSGVTLGLGTDNAMISQPDMIEEMKAAYAASRDSGDVSPSDIANLATFGGRKVLNLDAQITTEITEQKDFVVVRVGDDAPLKQLVTSSKSDDITALVRNGRIWRSSRWRK
ncbi:MAG TPA: amidohydrolase family protein [Thermoplasmata archaeon]